MPLSYLRADSHKQAVTHIRESRRFKLMYTLQGNPTNTPHISHAQSVYSPGPYVSHMINACNLSWVIDRFRRIPLLPRKRIPDSIPGTPADQSAGSHPVSLLLSTTEVVGLNQAFVDNRLLSLSGSYHRYAIGTFNTCSRGPTHRSLTDTCGGCNHLRAPSGLRLSNLNIASSKSDVKYLSPTYGFSTIQCLPKSISTPSNC
jgi:hypothetical protein